MEENAWELAKKLEICFISFQACWKCHLFRLCPDLNLTTPDFRSMEWSLDCARLSQNCLCCVRVWQPKGSLTSALLVHVFINHWSYFHIFSGSKAFSILFSKTVSLHLYHWVWKSILLIRKVTRHRDPGILGLRSITPTFAAYTIRENM